MPVNITTSSVVLKLVVFFARINVPSIIYREAAGDIIRSKEPGPV